MGTLTVPGFNQATNWLTLVTKLPTSSQDLLGILGPWRPPQWSRGIFSNQNQVYSLTVPAQGTGSSARIVSDNGIVAADSSTSPTIKGATASITYFFDAILRAEHRQELRKTEHPIQSGASIVDHAYLLPARVTLEIGMSDCMARHVAGQFTSSSSKSISAFQTLLDLQASRLPLVLNTRLASYANMLIESISAVENRETQFALKASVTLSQIIVANLATNTVSARPDSTDLTNEGTKQGVTMPSGFDTTGSLAGFP